MPRAYRAGMPRDPETSIEPGESDESRRGKPRSPDELGEIADHLRAVGRLLVKKAAKDPAVQAVASEAQKIFHRIEATAEPLVKQLGQELDRLSRRYTETAHRADDAGEDEARTVERREEPPSRA